MPPKKLATQVKVTTGAPHPPTQVQVTTVAPLPPATSSTITNMMTNYNTNQTGICTFCLEEIVQTKWINHVSICLNNAKDLYPIVVVGDEVPSPASKVFKDRFLLKQILKHVPIYTMFPNTILNSNNASWRQGTLLLTASRQSQVSYCWSSRRVRNLSNGFIAKFGIRMGKPRTTEEALGDGMAFVIQNHSQQIAQSRLIGGNSLGYSNIPNSLAIEFDIYANDNCQDPNDNHISVHTNGQGNNSSEHRYSIGVGTPTCQMNDYQLHHVIVTYNPHVPDKQMTISFDGVNIVQCSIVLHTRLKLHNDDEAYVGFTAATGLYHQEHIVEYFEMHRLIKSYY
ncbi:hypothetical protein SAMD00019534_076800 [Acytostelium subglobosum LB1]|uniref:hypothetical protein n=1 Tax=Acytostelium subglobosum LB1 TaxID=1410327 RepID=UPI0006448675|nr:hypothetical protein SAMD00019534_076800 [Acytostelium subglobosum LB1]GAM24505.1 hypothetical protein SAMD00019534_076800 [Acytostelium subglobosum LB1]|eukprot:XP_012752831.1 hypothetical protein SAMD00019534_076800 [Acytostelium subglobosum LB1]